MTLFMCCVCCVLAAELYTDVPWFVIASQILIFLFALLEALGESERDTWQNGL
jgi:hypothetical protein